MKIGEVEVSEDIFTAKFSCDYEKCKGYCCWAEKADDGQDLLGANVTKREGAKLLATPLQTLKMYSDATFRKPVKDGFIRVCDNKCIFANRDGCGLKKAENDGLGLKIPISCQLYPMIWDIDENNNEVLYIEHLYDSRCQHGYEKGERENVLLIDFLKDALIRLHGIDFYKALKYEANKRKVIHLSC